MECAGKYAFAGWSGVEKPNRVNQPSLASSNNLTLFQLYNLGSGNLSFQLLFARGIADPRSRAAYDLSPPVINLDLSS